MRNLDIKLENFQQIYRSKLSLPNYINFGFEFELDEINHDEVRKLIKRVAKIFKT